MSYLKAAAYVIMILIDYDSIMKHCAQRGLSDEDAIEDTIYALRDDKCEIMEPRFGWFKPM